jgi:hypothetical protein
VLVLQAFRRKNLLWLGAAILWHAAADASAVFVAGTWGVYWAEAAVGVFGMASLGLIFALRPSGAETRPESESAAPGPESAPSRIGLPNPEADLRRKMDETRFTS